MNENWALNISTSNNVNTLIGKVQSISVWDEKIFIQYVDELKVYEYDECKLHWSSKKAYGKKKALFSKDFCGLPSDTKLEVLDIRNGQKIWEMESYKSRYVTSKIIDNQIYLLTTSFFKKFNLQTGSEEIIDLGSINLNELDCGEIYGDNKLLLGYSNKNGNNKVVFFDYQMNQLVWERNLDKEEYVIFEKLERTKDDIIVIVKDASSKMDISILDQRDGSILLEKDKIDQFSLNSSTEYLIYSREGVVELYNQNERRVIWRKVTGCNSIFLSKSYVYFLVNNEIEVRNKETGDLISSYGVEKSISELIHSDDKNILVKNNKEIKSLSFGN